MSSYLFTSESVAIGHPDKVADQISDAVVDAALAVDPFSRVACEVLVCPGVIIVAGEITTKAELNFQKIVRHTLEQIGYTDASLGLDFRSCGILVSINGQSPDISLGVDERASDSKPLGAGDQGLMFGFACEDTPELMPLPIMLSHQIVRELDRVRKANILSYLGPDAKTQITIEYSENHQPLRVHTVVLSTQHAVNIDQKVLHDDMIKLIKNVIPKELVDEKTLFYINPTGRFTIGGPAADCGLTGRKIIVDTYGGMGRHGGGAFSGKDPTKVDRSASYAARYIAKNVVAAKLAKRCEIQVSYAIGMSQPISIKVDTFGTGIVADNFLSEAIQELFDLSPGGILKMLDLCRPIYQKTAFGGHFGRTESEFTWEKVDRAEALRTLVDQKIAENNLQIVL
ncbi:MAG: methionine adenosyltransferase [Parachlamydiaceae bacterium]|nr:methionine adenosyltransferase [Parachlamydiaceae bacterium]